jgi:lipopolysaccharide transport system permease protein
MLWYSYWPSWRLIALPVLIIVAFATAMASGLWISAMNVKYRDFRYIVPFIVQFGLYISPVGFSSSIIPEQYRLLYSINPMVGVIDGFRWAILGSDVSFYLPGFLLSIVLVALLLTGGFWFFRKTERTFADII